MSRLNGIQAEPGTLIGLDQRAQRFLAVHKQDERGVTLRFATAEESIEQAFMHEPRSFVEYSGIRRKTSIYGWIRRFKPVPTTPVKVEIPLSTGLNRAMRRKMKLKSWGLG